MPYKTWATNDVPTAADFNAMFADPKQATVTTEESTTSTSYGDLTTSGPSVTETLVAGQSCLVFLRALAINQTTSGGAVMSFTVSGVESLAAADANAGWSRSIERNNLFSVHWYQAGTTGSHTFLCKYKAEASGTAAFANRRITLKKF